PPIAGQADWYLQTQLANFKRGIRGKSPHDKTGPTMQAIAAGLDDQVIKDLAAFVATMPPK
ncbi:MAG: cytochrome c oxidase subunit II, partial [Deltaproteobacteria bacterium]|nr:cytochrome c oxidase subunit II [Deltaproteobacteria bacterium]